MIVEAPDVVVARRVVCGRGNALIFFIVFLKAVCKLLHLIPPNAAPLEVFRDQWPEQYVLVKRFIYASVISSLTCWLSVGWRDNIEFAWADPGLGIG